MRRRELITLVGGAIAAWPFGAGAQQASKIGYLSPITPSTDAPRREAFLRGLQEHGYVEGQNITIEYRWGEGKDERLADLVSQLVNLNVGMLGYTDHQVRFCRQHENCEDTWL